MWCSSTRKLSQLPSCSFSAPGALVCPDNAVRGRDVFIDNDLGAATYTRSANCVTLFRRTPPASSPSIRHRRLLPFPGGVACTLKTRLRQLCSGRASSILTEAPSVCSQGCGSSGVSPKSLRSCLGRPCNSALAASTTTSRLQGCRHGISCVAWSRSTVPEWSCSCRRPARSSPTSLVIITSIASSTIPAHSRRSTHISSRCIAPLWNSLPSDIRHWIIPISARLPSTS